MNARPAKTISIEISVWYDESRGDIHLSSESAEVASTVNAFPASARRHEHLYAHLARCLRKAGMPAPPAAE